MPDRAPVPVGTHSVTVPGDGPDSLPRPPGAVRRFWLRHRRLADVLVALAYLVLGLQGVFSVPLATGVAPPAVPAGISVAAVVVAAVSLLGRRSRPWWALATLWAASAVVCVTAGSAGPDPIGPAFGLYAVAVYAGARRAWYAFGASVIAAPLLAGALAAVRGAESVPAVLSAAVNPLFALVLLTATLVGVNVGGRRRYVGALLEHAAELARERDRRALLAVLDERTRIAREMHDVVAHSLTVMVALSDGAAKVVRTDAGRASQTLGEIGDVGRQSLGEMRRVLGVLSRPADAVTEDPAPLHPQPDLADVEDLAGTFEAAGLPVSVRSRGVPPVDPGTRHAVYRIVQEALTNALRHAAGARRVVVDLDHREGTIIDVTDDGAAAAGPVPSGPGRGLIGMRERAGAFGGTLEAGPAPGGGWQVRATLPATEGDRP